MNHVVHTCGYKGQKMIGKTISHYRILEKLGEVRNSPTSIFKRVVENFRIPPHCGGSEEV